MSEITRYDVDGRDWELLEVGDGDYVRHSDHLIYLREMRMDRDVERLRADTAEAEQAKLHEAYKNYSSKLVVDALKSEISAAEHRIAEVTELLRLMTVEYACCLEAGHDRITFLGGDCDSVSKMLADNVNYAKACAALNPKPEAGSHE